MAAGCAALFALVVVGAYFWGPGPDARPGGPGRVRQREPRLGRARSRGASPSSATRPRSPRSRSRSPHSRSCAAGRAWRWRVLALVAATSVSSELLKVLLAHPRFPPIFDYPVGPEALPSGHATAAMSLALAGVLVAPRRARWAAAVIGSGWRLRVGASVVAVGWHFPSDVIAGYLLATGWALVSVGGAARGRPPLPRATERWARTRSPARATGSPPAGSRCWPSAPPRPRAGARPAACSRTRARRAASRARTRPSWWWPAGSPRRRWRCRSRWPASRGAARR